MMQHEVRTPADALAYITECNLATVSEMAMKKSRPKREFSRQVSIAQIAVDWMACFSIELTGRAKNVEEAGSVWTWAEHYMPELRHD